MKATPGPVPEEIQGALDLFVESARSSFGSSLVSVVLFGSAAEGRLRPTSDVNVIVVLSRLDPSAAAAHRPAQQAAEAAIRLRALYLLADELERAVELFAQKFSDVLRRRVVLQGEDPFAGVAVPREALARRVEQVLVNLALRLRARAIALAPDDPAIPSLVAESAGPLRAAAAAIRELQGRPGESPKESLAALLSEVSAVDRTPVLDAVSRVRSGQALSDAEAATVLFALSDIAVELSGFARRLA